VDEAKTGLLEKAKTLLTKSIKNTMNFKYLVGFFSTISSYE